MKKIIVLLYVFCSYFLLIGNVYATDWSVGELTCNYEKGDNKISITYYNVGAALGDAEVYYRIIYTKGGTNYCAMGNSFISKCPSDSDTMWVTDILNFNSIFKYDGVQFYSIKNRLIRRGYNEEANFDESTLCSKGVLINWNESFKMDEITLCETNEDEAECTYNSTDLFTLKGKTIAVNPYAGSNDRDYTDSYNRARSDQEKYCDEKSSDYDADKCADATADVEVTTNTAAENGITEEYLENKYKELKVNLGLDFSVNGECSSLLGSTEYKENPDPAYYLQFIFNVMKYVALVLLFIFTVVEFGKATVSSNQDAIKKAINSIVKRLIIAVIIFFLPILIEFVLQLLGVYNAGTCGIS
ncbi:MAG: hypothetical protein NC483_00045 [Ruminococcus sp.]|nr:hypothetical protein [Ruminococcus sp.]